MVYLQASERCTQDGSLSLKKQPISSVHTLLHLAHFLVISFSFRITRCGNCRVVCKVQMLLVSPSNSIHSVLQDSLQSPVDMTACIITVNELFTSKMEVVHSVDKVFMSEATFAKLAKTLGLKNFSLYSIHCFNYRHQSKHWSQSKTDGI